MKYEERFRRNDKESFIFKKKEVFRLKILKGSG